MKKNSFLICKAAADCDKKCKVECIPTEEECPAVAELETALWVKEGWKVMNQYVNKQNALDESARTGSRKARNAEKDGIIEIKGEKWLNKLVKKERKKYLKRQRLLEKGRKSRERSAKAGRRNWNKKHKALLAFYASVEEKYKSICPDLNLYGGLSGSDQYFYNSVGGVLPPSFFAPPLRSAPLIFARTAPPLRSAPKKIWRILNPASATIRLSSRLHKVLAVYLRLL
jgi:hypothetical protein